MNSPQSAFADHFRFESIRTYSIEEGINAARPWFDMRKKIVSRLMIEQDHENKKYLHEQLLYADDQIKKILFL